jgi:hypothetical protein
MEVDAARAEGGACVASQASHKEEWSRMMVIGSVVGMLLKSPA